MTAPSLQQYVQGQGTVSADNLNSFEQTCDNVPQLRAFIGTTGNQVYIRGLVTPSDGGAGVFYWSASNTNPDDGVNTIVPLGVSPGGWIRILAGNGTVTQINIGTGLTGGPINSVGTISLQVPVAVANGGTGDTALAAHTVLVGGGTAAIVPVGPGTANQVLQSNGAAADPSFTSTITGLTLSGGTLAGTTTLPGSGQISAGGFIGIGMTPANPIDITENQNNVSKLSLVNSNNGASANAQLVAGNGTSSGVLRQHGTGWATTNVQRQDGTLLFGTGAGGVTISTAAPQPIFFGVNLALAASIPGIGQFALNGSTSGVVTTQVQAAAGTFNFNLPTTAGTSGQVLVSAGGGAAPMTWAAKGLLNVRQILSGSGTYTPTTGTTSILLFMVGGGGGGGGTAVTSGSSAAAASGGNAGASLTFYAASGFSGLAFSVGTGGAGGAAGANSGTAGNASTFGTVTAPGGAGGAGSGAVVPPFINQVTATPSTVTGTTINGAGEAGGYGMALAAAALGGVGGAGGNTAYGQGGFARNSTGAGNNANGIGAGGGGALGLLTAAAAAGGSGAAGIIIIYEYA